MQSLRSLGSGVRIARMLMKTLCDLYLVYDTVAGLRCIDNRPIGQIEPWQHCHAGREWLLLGEGGNGFELVTHAITTGVGTSKLPIVMTAETFKHAFSA